MNEMIFSWAENANGKMVHVDSVRQGLNCGCVCPCCHERLQARHGEIRAHGFAHHSEERGANLKICYMVTMYKLAEQIIKEEKRIHVPSYYGIFGAQDLEFSEVVIDGEYDRFDKQPDVIATTIDGERILIEFTFAYKVQHKKKIDYKNLNCVEFDLSMQSLESLHEFLMSSNDCKKWINNQSYFDRIESTYSQHGKLVKIKNEIDCVDCCIKDSCCGIRYKGQSVPIIIENCGNRYRVCKTEEYENLIKSKEIEEKQEQIRGKEAKRMLNEQDRLELIETSKISPELRSCFICRRNLDYFKYGNGDGYAHCGSFESLGVPKKTPPETAKTCQGVVFKERIR